MKHLHKFIEFLNESQQLTPEIEEFCKNIHITPDQYTGEVEIGGDLYLWNLEVIPQGFNPTIRGDLELGGLEVIPQGFNPTVGGDLHLWGLKEIPQGFNPTVGGSLNLRSLKEIPQGFNPTVGGDLNLSGLEGIPQGTKFDGTRGGIYIVPKHNNPNQMLIDLDSIAESVKWIKIR